MDEYKKLLTQAIEAALDGDFEALWIAHALFSQISDRIQQSS